MHIGLDASRATVARRTGTEQYALRLIRGLLEVGQRHQFTLYFRDQPAPDLFAGGRWRVIPFARAWTHLRLSAELLRARPRPEVLFVPAHVLPVVHPLPSVVTIHDLGYRHFPQAHPLRQRLYLDWSTRFSARAATRLIAVSRATRRDLIRFYNVPEHKITVIHSGYDDTLRPTEAAALTAKYALPPRYVLHVGTLQPRKNLAMLITAAVAAHTPLVLAGRPGWLSAPIRALAQQHAAWVRALDYVPDADLAALYSGAVALAFPSLYEGFGFPVLEAMACGAPVLCANTSSLPELAGEAAVLIDPLDRDAWVAALRRVWSDDALRAALRQRGFEQARSFTWARAAQQTLAVLEQAAQT